MIIVFEIVLCVALTFLAAWISVEYCEGWPILGLFLLLGLMVWGSININQNVCNIPKIITTSLYAGYNNNEINGQFFLGSGSVNEKDMVYYWINDNDVKSKHSKTMDESVFIEDGKNVMVEKFNTCPSNLSWLLFDNNLKKIEFHVPENSIVQMYQYH
jgi:hypothetical protein